MSYLYIPLHRSDESIAIPFDQLSATDPKDLVRLMVKERVPYEIWLRVATAYRKIGRIEAFETMIQMATGAKQRRGYSAIAQSASENRGSGGRVMSVDEEMGLTQDWMRVRAYGDYETSVSMAMLFDAMAAHLVNASMRLGSLTKAEEGVGVKDEGASFLSEREREKRRRDLATEATWYLQQAESVEKQKFIGQSSEWYHRLIAGLQYFSKKDDGKALVEFKASQSLFESRSSRIGIALVLIRGAKYVDALEELSRVYMSIYGAKFEKMNERIASDASTDDSSPYSSHSSPHHQHQQADYEWFKAHTSEISNTNPNLELLTSFACLRPLMALLWSKIGSYQRAIDILRLHLKLVDEAISPSSRNQSSSSTGSAPVSIDHLPANHDRSLSMLATLLINQHGEVMQRAKSTKDVEEASNCLSEAVSLLKRAFQLNPENPNVLNHLSNIFFTQKSHEERDYERIDGFAAKAKEIALQAGFKDICAESSYYLGRSSHARSKYVAARQHYMDSLVYSPNFPLPRFALAQLSLHENDITQAIEHLTKLDAKFPDLADSKAFLGKMHLLMAQNTSSPQDYQTHFSHASKLLARAIQLNPSNLKAHLDLAELKERHSPLESLQSYLHASDLSFQQILLASKLDLDSYKQLAQNMWDAAASQDPQAAQESNPDLGHLFPSWIKRVPLQTSRIVWNNVAVMRLHNNLLTEAKDAILRTILLGASSTSSPSSPNTLTFINPASHIKSAGMNEVTPLPTSVVFASLFAKPLRDILPSQVSSLLETFILDSRVYLLPSTLSSGYNLGLCYEKMKENEKASQIYASILDRYPTYLDAKLRLAIIKRDEGDLTGAETALKEITSFTSQADSKASSTAKSLAGIVLANLMMLKKEFKETQSMMDVLVNKLSASKSSSSTGPSAASQDSSSHWSFGSDVYSLTSYANFFLSTSYASPNREKNLKWASGLFSTVLKQSPGNIYAANGLAIIQAIQAKEELMAREKEESEGNHDGAMEGVSESASSSGKGSLASSSSQKMGGKWSEKSRNALNAFLAIREAMPNLPDILVNLGHLSFAVGDYRGAAKHYQAVWTRYGASAEVTKSGQVSLFLARSLAQLGHFDQAKSIMEATLAQSPDDEDMQFNLAVLCKEWALGVLKKVDMSLAARMGHQRRDDDANDANDETGEEGEAKESSAATGGTSASSGMDVDQVPPTTASDAPTSTQGAGKLSTSTSSAQSSTSKISIIISTSIPSEDDQRKAIELLTFAGPIFERLVNPKNPKHLFSTKKCEKFAKLCETNRDLACEKLETFREEMEKERAEAAERRRKVEEEEQNQLLALQAQEAALAAQLAQENEIAEALRLKSQQLVEEWAATGGGDDENGHSSRASRKSSSSRKKANRGRNAYDSDDDEESANARIARRREEEGGAGSAELDSGAAAAGSSQPSTIRTRRKTRDEDEDEEDDDEDFGATSSAPTAKVPKMEEQRQMADAKRRSQLEEMTKRRQQAKRGHDGITPGEDDEGAADSSQPAASSSAMDSTSQQDTTTTFDSQTKRRKLRENKERNKDDEDDLELPDGLDL